MAEEHTREGKALGSEEGEISERGFVVSRGKELSWGFTACDLHFSINVGRAALV
jgi:hypothetical protein